MYIFALEDGCVTETCSGEFEQNSEQLLNRVAIDGNP
jgi:hypothetical protein